MTGLDYKYYQFYIRLWLAACANTYSKHLIISTMKLFIIHRERVEHGCCEQPQSGLPETHLPHTQSLKSHNASIGETIEVTDWYPATHHAWKGAAPIATAGRAVLHGALIKLLHSCQSGLLLVKTVLDKHAQTPRREQCWVQRPA